MNYNMSSLINKPLNIGKEFKAIKHRAFSQSINTELFGMSNSVVRWEIAIFNCVQAHTFSCEPGRSLPFSGPVTEAGAAPPRPPATEVWWVCRPAVTPCPLPLSLSFLPHR